METIHVFDELHINSGTYLCTTSGPVFVQQFWMDRNPITVARYSTFIEGHGYLDDSYWDDEGWNWRTQHSIVAPRFWDDAKWERFLSPNQPVVGVSYYEAQAFCRFFGRRLPTEVEWEAACRGADGRMYPWGNRWDENKLGNRGKNSRVTWPVGSFAEARGPFGHNDLVGNVWQWTSDFWTPNDREHIATRGGSWASRADQCRADYRNAYKPDGRWSHLGFRTCRQ